MKKHPPLKQAALGAKPLGEKQPKTASEPPSYNDRKAAWHVGRIQLVEPYGWNEIPSEQIQYVREKLAHFEKKTWNEIFVVDKKYNHAISVGDLRCKIAKGWMQRNMPDQDSLWTLRFSGAERVWGVYSGGVYQIVFWDPKHRIYPSEK